MTAYSDEKRSFGLFSGFSHYLPGFRGMMMMLVMFIAGSLLGNIVILTLQAGISAGFAQEYGTVISYPLMFIPAMLYAWSKSRKAKAEGYPKINVDNVETCIPGGLLMIMTVSAATIAAAFLVEPLGLLLPPMPQWLKEMMEKMLDAPLWVTLISVSVFAPFFEEWLCRGVIMRGMLHSMHPSMAIIISAAFFAVIHMNPWQALPAFCLGVLFGFVYYRTGSLKLTMVMHCVNNSLAVIISKIPALSEAETFMDILSTPAYIMIYILSAVIVGCTVIIIKGKSEAMHSCLKQD